MLRAGGRRMTMTRRLAQVGCDQLGELVAALRSAGLPFQDLCGATAIYRLEDDAGPIGWAALESRDGAALLRSVVIADGRRGSGAGAELVRGAIDRAAADGIGELWLLTETARPFFTRIGFTPADRASAPAAIQATAEFANLCPASADCMKLKLPVE